MIFCITCVSGVGRDLTSQRRSMAPPVKGLLPHPAFPRFLLTSKSDTPKQHQYPRDYLTSLLPLPDSIDSLPDLVGYLVMQVAAFISLLLAWTLPTWLLEGDLLGFQAWCRSPAEVIFFRRLLLLESLAWAHGLVAGYLHHLKGLLHNSDSSETVLPLLAEFQSHRVHMTTLLQTLQPNIITRWLLLILQAVTIPPYFLACVVNPAFCHATARFVANLAARLYTDGIRRHRDYEFVLTRKLGAPPIAQAAYGLDAKATLGEDVFLHIRGDDLFHCLFNWVATTECHYPCRAMQPSLGHDAPHHRNTTS